MNPIKVIVAGALGVITTLGLLFLMNSLVNNDLGEAEEKASVKIPDIRMPNTKIETRYEEAKPDKPEEPETPPPDLPEPEFETPDLANDALNMKAPLAKADLNMNGGSLAFSEGEYLPIVKVPPEYPSSALSRGIEGFCTVEYTVTETGTTRDPQPIESECITKEGKPTSVFNRASVKAALKFKYKPKVVDGKPVEVSGVKNKFTYVMQK
jgi:periplasmic protein TonB